MVIARSLYTCGILADIASMNASMLAIKILYTCRRHKATSVPAGHAQSEHQAGKKAITQSMKDVSRLPIV